MVQAVAGEQALKQRKVVTSGGTGAQYWRTNFLGKRGDGQLSEDQPQAFLVEMSANETIVPHFHEVDQFQIFVAGSGGMGRNAAAPLVVHYADHHTGYGPINAGPQGYSYFTLRAKSDPGAHYLHKPGYRDLLKPSLKRHATVSGVALSTEPVLMDLQGQEGRATDAGIRRQRRAERAAPAHGTGHELHRPRSEAHRRPVLPRRERQHGTGGRELFRLVYGVRDPGRRAARVHGGTERARKRCCCSLRERSRSRDA